MSPYCKFGLICKTNGGLPELQAAQRFSQNTRQDFSKGYLTAKSSVVVSPVLTSAVPLAGP